MQPKLDPKGDVPTRPVNVVVVVVVGCEEGFSFLFLVHIPGGIQDGTAGARRP